jgi:ribose/xylose/arabinose/galactoside ABC-type transport system permease subunit
VTDGFSVGARLLATTVTAIVAMLGLPPIVVTLASLSIVRGAVLSSRLASAIARTDREVSSTRAVAELAFHSPGTLRKKTWSASLQKRRPVAHGNVTS